MRTDADNTKWLAGVVAEHGWPGIALVGEEGSDAAWLLAQHADGDPGFQARALDLITAAHAAGDVPGRHLAYLTDRVRTARGEPQVYGTQYEPDDTGVLARLPTIELAHLDDRRTAMGLEPAADNDARIRALYPSGGNK
ncbi:DUF6624 domain-containing protein [Streptomyces sp. NPDC006326]|uniref:DUF6624 domain-containing protein n=1 Tax=Streptomyces sp. NPDC006326 TaxID=3156752 RepID=UPI0033B772DB